MANIGVVKASVVSHAEPGRNRATGIWLGALGVTLFSFTLPATKIAVGEFHPILVAGARTLIVFPFAAAFLFFAGHGRPPASARRSIAVLVMGNVVGFPLFTALSLEYGSAANAAVILGLMPLATAVVASSKSGERLGRRFWMCALGGAASVMTFSAVRNGMQAPAAGDLFSLLAVATGSFGYAEGAVLTRDHGAMRSISWGIVFGAPLVLPVCLYALSLQQGYGDIGSAGWGGLLYIALVSSFLAFIPWNTGLAMGGVARVSQIQLTQPLLTLAWSAVLLGEHITGWAIGASLVVLLFVFGAARARAPRQEVVSPSGRRDDHPVRG